MVSHRNTLLKQSPAKLGTTSRALVLITGASSGIGEALAYEFARSGARVVLVGRRLALLEEAARKVEALGGEALALPADVTRDGELEAVVKKVSEVWGELDCVVANAGFGVVGRADELRLEDYRRQFETNVFGVLRTFYATVGSLKKTRGTLVLIGSVAGHIALPEGSPYSMSKFAVRSFAEALRPELKADGVSVILVSPGFVASEFRQIDNEGKRHPNHGDPVSRWLLMSTEQAAREIYRAVLKRKPEAIITFHGKVLVFLKRHLPVLISFGLRWGIRSRGQPHD